MNGLYNGDFMKKAIFNEIIELKNYIRENKGIILYGAGTLAKKIIIIADTVGCKNHISKIVVSEKNNNVKQLCGILVTDNIKILDEANVFIGTVDYREEIIARLTGINCNCFCVSDKLGNYLLKGTGFCNDKYIQDIEQFINSNLNLGENKRDKKDIVFFTPPYWDAYSPFSAVPCLVAAMKKNGFSVAQYDCGIICVNNTLIREWDHFKRIILSKRYYDDYIKQYQYNTYDTWEAYHNEVDIILGKIYCLHELKSKYVSLDDTQRAALDGIFSMAEWFEVNTINFDVCENIDEEISKFYNESFFEYMLSQHFIKATETIGNIVGISITSTGQFVYGCAVAKIIKRVLPHVKIIFGGSCADVFFKSKYANKKDIFRYFDYAVIGEGETAVIKLVQAILDSTSTENIPNLISFGDEECTLPSVFVEDIESLEPPDYDGLDLEQYLSPRKLLAYQSSRGCHYGGCAFCNHDDKYRHNYRTKNPYKIVKDLLWLHEKYKVDCFQFVDEAIRPDCFEKMIEVMDGHEAFKKIKWFYYSRVSYKYTKEILEKAKKNGCEMVMLGIETLNQRLLNFIKKGITVGASLHTLKVFHDCGIKTFSWLMTNLPSETLDEARKDLEDIKNASEYIDAMDVGPFMLVSNTDMYHDPEKFNIIKKCSVDPVRFESHNNGEIIDKDEMLKFFQTEYYPYTQKMNLNVSRYTLFFRNNSGCQLVEKL